MPPLLYATLSLSKHAKTKPYQWSWVLINERGRIEAINFLKWKCTQTEFRIKKEEKINKVWTPKGAIDAEWMNVERKNEVKGTEENVIPKTHRENRCASIFNPYNFKFLWFYGIEIKHFTLSHEWVEKTVKVDLNIEVKCAKERQTNKIK